MGAGTVTRTVSSPAPAAVMAAPTKAAPGAARAFEQLRTRSHGTRGDYGTHCHFSPSCSCSARCYCSARS